MSRYSGSYKEQHKPAAAVREQKRAEAEERNARTPDTKRARYRREQAAALEKLAREVGDKTGYYINPYPKRTKMPLFKDPEAAREIASKLRSGAYARTPDAL